MEEIVAKMAKVGTIGLSGHDCGGAHGPHVRQQDDGANDRQPERDQNPIVSEKPHWVPGDMTSPVSSAANANGTMTYQPVTSIAIQAVRTV